MCVCGQVWGYECVCGGGCGGVSVRGKDKLPRGFSFFPTDSGLLAGSEEGGGRSVKSEGGVWSVRL